MSAHRRRMVVREEGLRESGAVYDSRRAQGWGWRAGGMAVTVSRAGPWPFMYFHFWFV